MGGPVFFCGRARPLCASSQPRLRRRSDLVLRGAERQEFAARRPAPPRLRCHASILEGRRFAVSSVAVRLARVCELALFVSPRLVECCQRRSPWTRGPVSVQASPHHPIVEVCVRRRPAVPGNEAVHGARGVAPPGRVPAGLHLPHDRRTCFRATDRTGGGSPSLSVLVIYALAFTTASLFYEAMAVVALLAGAIILLREWRQWSHPGRGVLIAVSVPIAVFSFVYTLHVLRVERFSYVDRPTAADSLAGVISKSGPHRMSSAVGRSR